VADYQEIIFGNKSALLQKITPEQNHKLQLVYQQELQKKIEMNKIPIDEIDVLVASLMEIVDDLEKVMAGGDPYADQTTGDQDEYSRTEQRWPLGKFQKIPVIRYLSLCCMFR
jgi:hypothetical protein